MTESIDIAESAFAILQNWSWGYIDPDGVPTNHCIPLDDVLNRLAFGGHDDPAKAILKLLCDDRLMAVCDYQWLKFKHYQTFRSSGTSEIVEKDKWQTLRKNLSEVKYGGEESDWEKVKISLDELDLKDCETAEWRPEYRRCSYALCSTAFESHEDGYFEEWFAATNI